MNQRPPLTSTPEGIEVLSGISPPFEGLFRARGQIAHALLTRAPLYSLPEGSFLVRLACLIHAASVRSEPGSNSPLSIYNNRKCSCSSQSKQSSVETGACPKTGPFSRMTRNCIRAIARYSVVKELNRTVVAAGPHFAGESKILKRPRSVNK